MLEAYGWAIARSSREAYDDASPDDVDAIDARVTVSAGIQNGA
jgi:hypothetical protein